MANTAPTKPIKVFADSQDSCKLSRQLQALKTVADFQDNFRRLQTVDSTADSFKLSMQMQTDHCRLVCFCLFNLMVIQPLNKVWGQDHGLPFM